ncbi:uncharacterized protein LOC125220428 [Salvia hispanica]|uniref:uncharacterized protein LOC125220428 n=1 Tax=Salvia hispanica TaxID=49212 RepID=UPI002009D350|nr:uncharacterized protein LOC125220428 [Salvia hispanica]
MEGLIPVVYRSLKRNKIRRRYECLSSGAAHAYNIKDFDYHDQDHIHDRRDDHLDGGRNRRCSSLKVDHTRSFDAVDDACEPKRLVRFRSYRMVSCLSCAA